MQKPKHIVIVAGEESGDQHAAALARDLKARIPDVVLSGMGGQHMSDAGVDVIMAIAKYGITGLASVVSHASVIREAFKRIKSHLETVKPDLLVLVDYPGFNLRLAAFAKEHLGIKIVYYISPQIWAWKAKRIHTIKKYVDHMAVILPFEKKLYQEHQVKASFVGHPLLEKLAHVPHSECAKAQLNLSAYPKLLGLLPGSRKGEIKYLMPILAASAKVIYERQKDIHFVIPVAKTLSLDWVKSFWDQSVPATFIKESAQLVMSACDAVVVASGTASLECALLQKPMAIIYKGSKLSYLIAFRLIKVRYFGLCNLLMDGMIVPELLQDDCRVETLAPMMQALLEDNALRQRMTHRLEKLATSLSSAHQDASIADVVVHELTV